MKRTRWLLVSIVGVAAGAVVAADTPQAWIVGKPYDLTSPADRALARFERSHPNCPLWTDWHKLCSRTGPGGSTHCSLDLAHPVTPSAPFCAKDPRLSVPAAEAQSKSRFCVRRVHSWRENDKDVATGPLFCAQYGSDRPFSGETLAQMLHPACTVWGLSTGRKLCAVDDNADPSLPPCGAPEIARAKSSPFVCMKWVGPKPCSRPVGGREPETGDIVFGDPYDLKATPVWGTYCLD